MPDLFDPRLDILPEAQRQLWPMLAPARALGFVLYGGTAIALQMGHRESIDFDFFSAAPLDKAQLREAFGFMDEASILDDALNTLAVSAATAAGPVKVSFFGHIRIGHIYEPLQARDGVLRCATLSDLLATKLKTILDRAEAKDYRDIAALLSAGIPLDGGIAAAKLMFGAEPRTILMALGYFEDGDVSSISPAEKHVLTRARDRIRDLPELLIRPGLFSES